MTPAGESSASTSFASSSRAAPTTIMPAASLLGPVRSTGGRRGLAGRVRGRRPGPRARHRWLHVSGERRLVAWSTTPIVDETGEERRLVHGTDVTERRHQEEELRRSRTRIVEAEAAERRRLERNLHDGAQQRLVSLSLAMRLAQGKLSAIPRASRRSWRTRVPSYPRARRASGARARDPSGGADRPRARRGARGAVDARDPAGRDRRAARATASRAVRGGGVLRRLRGAGERRQVRARVVRPRQRHVRRRPRDRRGRRRRGRRRGRRAAVPGCAGWPTASTLSTGSLPVDSPPGEGTLIRAVIPLDRSWYPAACAT